MESPITTECDALREEVALLTAENTRLLNELNALRQGYPEAAIIAVWEHGLDVGSNPQSDVLWMDHAEEVKRVFADIINQKGGYHA